ncbi:hypothetical protein Z169_06824, partial [Egretta garzetta]
EKKKNQNQPNQTQGGERSTGECSLEFKPYAPVPFLRPTFCDA